ncbi:uncharacterized protein E5676_scaffold174G00450 [Cucumis melo var. makuwa]|uniref:Uncharacterized protein n=1 Tax=Cucumis melo var. makuwa TaxID=1194695 RepID=A0A5A7VHN6_CUCMM|nr:uncharacterized protein E6C27_scaffold485G00590 [Cucumis melo var. makuwa]TYJ97167.1 uncharacterized protein E5676_scaffold174G00450 [Cucumis melo var. makuwa]
MVRRSESCLGSRLKNIKSNKYDPILIDDNTKGNVTIAKRRLFKRVLKEKGKETQTENVSKKRKLEKVVKAREEKKDNNEKKRGKIAPEVEDDYEVYECIPLLTGSSTFCAQRIDHKKICMLNWVVDNHPEWKELAERVFDHEEFQYKAMFPDDDFVERNLFQFHEMEMREEN